MPAVIADIDHLLTYVASLEAAAGAYERLGFTLTPVSDITAMGIANRLALMRPRNPRRASFIELMAVTDQARLPPLMRPLLMGEEGIKSMVLLTPDAGAAHASLVARGYAFAPPVHVKREWILSPSESVWPEFDVLLPIPAPLAFNACQYHNVELYHRPAWTEHANTAQFVRAAYAVASDVAATAAYYERLFEAPVRREPDGSMSVTPGQIELRIYGLQAFAATFDVPQPPLSDSARYVGYEIEVGDTEACRRVLERNGVAHRAFGQRLIVAPYAANGNLVVFVQGSER
jgi:Glyoxalase-like domain